jgi:hypothetical protein
MPHKLDHTPTLVPVDLTVPSNHRLGLQISASFPHMSLFLKNTCKFHNIVRYQIWPPVVRHIGYDNIGPSRDGEVFNNIPGLAQDLRCQRYDFIASGHPEEVRNDSVETHGLLYVVVVSQARCAVNRCEIDSP